MKNSVFASLATKEKAEQYELLRNTLGTLPKHIYDRQGKIDIKKLFDWLQQKGYKKYNRYHELEDYLLDNMDKFKLTGKLKIPKSRKEELKKRQAQSFIDSFEESLTSFEMADANDVVIRSYLGDGPTYIYKGGALTKKQLNMLKAAYSILNGIDYFHTRPILFKNWSNLPDERKHQTYQTDFNF